MPSDAQQDARSPVDYAPSVLNLRGSKVLHFAVWADHHLGPLCRTRGLFVFADFGTTMDFPGGRICRRCCNEVRLFVYAMEAASE